jgi:hypothetical protein
VYDAEFVVPDDAFSSVRCAVDTTQVADGEHTVTVRSGDDVLEVSANVDNTAPSVTTSIADGDELRGEVDLDADISDGDGQGVDGDSVTTSLDGETVQLPLQTSSTELAAGEYTLVVTAADLQGNVAEETVQFTVPEENPSAEVVSFPTCDANGSISVTDPIGDDLNVSVQRGETVPVADLEVTSGTVHDGAATDREGTAVTGDELAALAEADGEGVSATAVDALPYQQFTAAVPEGTGAGDEVRVQWQGEANPGTRVTLYALSNDGGWVELGHQILAEDSDGEVSFSETVDAGEFASAGEVQLLVQNGVGWAGEDRSDRDSAYVPVNEGDTPRSDYDATIAWETDTQYYNETEDYYKHQVSIHDYLLKQRDPMNIQYLSHTGDIVNVSSEAEQWERADEAYQRLDDVDFPYGVLAGNHDVGHKDDDYSHYNQWFGADRYKDSPWWGGDHEDNRGHYDLVTVAGVDFIYLYMGWGAGDEQIDWMNEVLAQYPERTAVINMHEFLTTTGGRGAIPERAYQEVIVPNENVAMVQSGHYHDAYVQQYPLDDDGDGVTDRTVAAVLFDYQALPEGGQGYLRLQHLDSTAGTITNRTYSYSLDDYDTDDPTIELEAQEFTLNYSDLGIVAHEKSLTTDRVQVDVLTDEVLAEAQAASGSEVAVAASELTDSWYLLVTDAYGGTYRSDVFDAAGDCATPAPTDSPAPTESDDAPATPAPTVTATPPASGGDTPSDGDADDSGEGLATTGADGMLALTALALTAIAAGALLLRRRGAQR